MKAAEGSVIVVMMPLVSVFHRFFVLFFHLLAIGFAGFFHSFAVSLAAPVMSVVTVLVLVVMIISVVIPVGCVDGVE